MTETDERADSKNENTTKQTVQSTQKRSIFKQFGHWCKHRKRYAIPLAVLIVIAAVLAVPQSRYAVAGSLWRQPVVVTVTDTETGVPVSQATVKMAGYEAVTDATGKATLVNMIAGFHQLTIEKPNYKNKQVNVEAALFSNKTVASVKLEATGRPVAFTVADRISGQPVADALVSLDNDNAAKSDKDGTASIVVPAGQPTIDVTVTNDDYNQAKVTLSVGKANKINLTPKGQMYFLSKRTGKIDVVRTNLDGTDRKTIVKGTGLEDDNQTSLLASRDWRYLVLHAKRGEHSGLYLLDTKINKLETIDQAENDQTFFGLVGWSGHRFIYTVNRDRKSWEAGETALKSYDARTQQLKVIEETEKGVKESYRYAYDDVSQRLHSFYILKNDQIVYVKEWNGPEWRLGNRQTEIASIQADGSAEKTLKSYKASRIGYIEVKLYTPQNIHYRVWDSNNKRLENVQTVNGAITPVPASQQKFDQSYPTFLISPDGKRSFWAESRDGKNSLFVADNNATGGTIKQLATLSEYAAYGWFTDKYLLLKKDNSELYITTPESLKNSAKMQPLKVSDYHKPSVSFIGYGYGYGGL